MHRRSASKIPFPTAAPPQENRCLWKNILPVKIKRKVSLLLDEGLLSWQDVLEVRQGDATPRPRRARSSPARSLGPRCFHANLDSRRAPPPASSSPPLRPHATLTLTPPRRRPSATSSSSSRRARLPSRARASPHAPRRTAPPGTPSRATLPSLPAAPPRPRALVHTLPPPAYACRRPVPSPRQWERAEPRQAVPDGAPPDRPRPLLSRVAGSCTPLAPPPHRSRSRSLSR